MDEDEFERTLADNDIIVQNHARDADSIVATSPHGRGIVVAKPQTDQGRKNLCNDLIKHFRGKRNRRGG